MIESAFSGDRFRSIPVIDGFLNLIYTENRGAIWGIFQRHSRLITVVSVAALVIIFIYFFRIPRKCRLELWAFTFLCGGALGNILDRLLQGYVVDFVDMQFGTFHWATYNVADSAITVGVTLLVISLVFSRCPPPEKKDKENHHASHTL
jgi:signal peptidase II